MLLALLSLFYTGSAPLEMPRASAYLVTQGDYRRLEDRFNCFDLWTSQTIDGRWIDDDSRVFGLATLIAKMPSDDSGVLTRGEFERTKEPLTAKDLKSLHDAVAYLSPIEIVDEPENLRQRPNNLKAAYYWQGTNRNAIVCSYLRETEIGKNGRPDRKLERKWRLATWLLAEGDDYDKRKAEFEELFIFGEERDAKGKSLSQWVSANNANERELLRRDARHSVAAYPEFRVTDADEFSVVDDLQDHEDFIVALTNEMKTMRAKYAATLPTRIDCTNTLAVARIFANREEYLEALAADGHTNMVWSAAYWSPLRRELVAYLPADGEARLLKTIRHEAFHQYLSYATSMISVSPWLNEGYAEYFEDEQERSELAGWTAEKKEALSKWLPAVMMMDYTEFYSGSDIDRKLKYMLARSIAEFIEKGSEKVRFKPFAKLKSNYFTALVESEDMRKATAAALVNKEGLELFVREWLKYWQNM